MRLIWSHKSKTMKEVIRFLQDLSAHNGLPYLLSVIVLGLLPGCRQSSCSGQTILQHNFADTLHITIDNGLITVPVEIGGRIRPMILDTGAEMSFWTAEETEGAVAQSETHAAYYTHRNTQEVAELRFPTVRIGHVTMNDYPMLDSRGSALTQVACGRFYGLLSCNFIDKGISFKIDTEDSLLIITDRKDHFKEERHFPSAKFRTWGDGCPYIAVRTPMGNLNVLFDTGAQGTWFDINQEYWDEWSQRPGHRKRIEKYLDSTPGAPSSQVGLFGTEDKTANWAVFHFPALRFGTLTVTDLEANTAGSSLIGSGILENASVILDAHRKRLYFLPHDGGDTLKAGNRSTRGLSVRPSADKQAPYPLQVTVREGKEAWRKGVRTGDYILEYNGVPIRDICTYILLKKQDKDSAYKFVSPDGTVKEVVFNE